MGDSLKVQRLVASNSPDVYTQVLTSQCIAKILKPATFQHGFQPGKLVPYSYGAGEMILSRRDTAEWVRWTSDAVLLVLELPDSALQAVAQATGADRIEIEGTPRFEDKRVAALIEAVEQEQADGFPSGRLYLDGIGQALAAAVTQVRGVLRKPLRSYSGALTPPQLRRVTEYIHERIDEDMSVMQLAETVQLSPAYFSQMFQRSTGYAPHQFVIRTRIQRAKEMLITSERKIIEVALACGFETSQHFARVFQKLCNVTPSEFRRQARLP
ncbi:helix-turn-helix domain-containing protein [Acidicapsa ligni]|uniref:helix-turn-helix domain-containing protein n=1 Tax=Acidicapsa ligni TaxID=542300 RepID=UPI0021E04EE8|nr:AraC family transcriptional regulator [Acidicapsa ligni]